MKGFCLEVSGPYACFTRPEMKVERVSYDVITPSAARAPVNTAPHTTAPQNRTDRPHPLFLITPNLQCPAPGQILTGRRPEFRLGIYGNAVWGQRTR